MHHPPLQLQLLSNLRIKSQAKQRWISTVRGWVTAMRITGVIGIGAADGSAATVVCAIPSCHQSRKTSVGQYGQKALASSSTTKGDPHQQWTIRLYLSYELTACVRITPHPPSYLENNIVYRIVTLNPNWNIKLKGSGRWVGWISTSP